MNSEIDIKEIKDKLIDKLRPSGWADMLKAFILSDDFDKIITDLVAQVDDGKRFTPQLKYVFTAFEECNWEDLKVVVLGQDSYPTLGVATGIAFDCSFTDKEQPSLKYLNDAIERTVIDSSPRSTDLRYLANQGVLLINCALTCELNKPGTHYKIWESFIAYLLDTITSKKKDIVFILMGKKAQDTGELIYDKSDKPETGHYKLEVSHPASASYNKLSEWDCKDVFNETNKILIKNDRTTIKW